MIVWRSSLRTVVTARVKVLLCPQEPFRFFSSATATPKRERKKKSSSMESANTEPTIFSIPNKPDLCIRSVPITIVDTVAGARTLLDTLMSMQDVVAWNIEATDIDTKRFHTAGTGGRVLCASAYVPNKLCVFVDAQPLGDDDEGLENFESPILEQLTKYFESECHLKTSHSVADDIHVLAQHGIKLRGVESDTRYLARLANTALSSWEGSAFKHSDPYAGHHETTTVSDPLGTAKGYDLRASMENFHPSFLMECNDKKMEKFLKKFNGPKIAHYSATMRDYWIQRSLESAAITNDLRDLLKTRLESTEWTSEVFPSSSSARTMWDLARSIHTPLVCLLASVEQTGIGIDEPFLSSVREKTEKIVENHKQNFYRIASSMCDPKTGKLLNPGAHLININSVHHVRQLLFGFPSERESDWFQYGKKSEKLRIPNKAIFQTDNGASTVTISGIGLRPIPSKLSKKRLSDFSAKGLPSVNQKLLAEYAGQPDMENNKLGRAADKDQLISFASPQYVREACLMMHHLLNAGKYDYVISSFIDPLMEKIVNHDRIHPSLSLDTSTGRLVCRKPNLHNPPNASDTLGVRAAFVASPGNSLIVADYSQLELRILAHVANCESMIKSLNAGGDYHSWTAYDMFSEVREAVDSGACQIAATSAAVNTPLVKSVFGGQRSKAKAINFSIAYGKCARSIAEEMDIELTEAEQLLTRWYASKPEVAQWKLDTVFSARVTKKVKSILGRTRDIPHINKAVWKGRSERAAVNHCIQGSAADIAICAMLRIGASSKLSQLGYKLLMQIHDEFIIEGPSENATEAKKILTDIMRNPFHDINPGYKFKVELEVDAGIGHSWLEAKP